MTASFAWDHLLYRLFDEDGQLLYVGRTNDLRRRFDRHSRAQTWWPTVARSEVETFPDFTSLCAAEKDAIITDRPLHNVIYNGRAVVSHDGEPAPAYLTISDRVTTVANVLHAQCRRSREANYPEDGADDSPPCLPCMQDAVGVVEALDAATGEVDPSVPTVRDMIADLARAQPGVWPPVGDDSMLAEGRPVKAIVNTAVARERDGAGNPF